MQPQWASNGHAQKNAVQGEQYDTETKLQNGMGEDDPIPASPDPLSPRRTDLKPSDRPSVDELPDNDGTVPLERNDETPAQEELADVDIDNAEFDDQPNPR